MRSISLHLYHSGVTDNSIHYGVAIALSGRAHKSLQDWEPIPPCLAMIRLKGTIYNVSLIAVYAPILDSDDLVKDAFYNELQATVNKITANDMLVIAGDWNDRTGKADAQNRTSLVLANGDRRINFAFSNHLTVSNTKFQHPEHHLVPWYSNDGVTATQIDYILVRKRWASNVLDCRVYRGAETGNTHGSDHALDKTKPPIRLEANNHGYRQTRFDITTLKRQDIAECFRLDLRN